MGKVGVVALVPRFPRWHPCNLTVQAPPIQVALLEKNSEDLPQER